MSVKSSCNNSEINNTNSILPEGLFCKEQSYFFLSSIISPKPTAILGDQNCYGLRFAFGPLAIEIYTSDNKPRLEPWRGIRLVAWQSLTHTNSQKGWWHIPFTSSTKQEGYFKLTPDYTQTWSKHALRHLRKWRNNQNYSLQKTNLENFTKAYHASKKLNLSLRESFIRGLQARLHSHPQNVHLYLVRDLQKEKDVAGLAVVDYPDINQSVHAISFMHSEVQKTSIGYGLIDEWYQQALKRNIAWLNFGLIWQKGDPLSWQGYSKFKRQFGLHFLRFPRNYWKITFGLFN